MNILVISENIPQENGGMRLLYEILQCYKGEDIVKLLCFEKEKCDTKLSEKISFIPWSIGARREKNGSPFYKKIKVQKRITNYRNYIIPAENYDVIIGFSYHNLCLTFENFKGRIYNIAMDSAALLFLRGVINQKSLKMKAACLIRLLQVLRTEKKVASISECSFTVGQSDADMYKYLYHKNAINIPHPYNSLTDGLKCQKWNSSEKLKICFAGALTKFYAGNLLPEVFEEILKNKKILVDKISLHFLGNCYCSEYFEILKKEGFTVEHINYVESFEEYLCNKNLMVVPLAVGAGTKNRVLNALCLGLDVITTDIGAENVYGIEPIHIANNAEQILAKLINRLETKELYGYSDEKINDLKKYHNNSQWTEKFWANIK